MAIYGSRGLEVNVLGVRGLINLSPLYTSTAKNLAALSENEKVDLTAME